MKNLFSKDRRRQAVSVIFAFILSLCVFFITLGCGCIYACTNDFVLQSIDTSGYATKAVAELTSQLNDLAIPSGLPHDYFDGKFNPADIKSDLLSSCRNILEGKEANINISKVEAEILGWVTDYSTETAGEISSETVNELTLFSQECAAVYLKFINPPLLNLLLPLFKTVTKYAFIAAVSGLIVSAFCLIFIFKINSAHSGRKFCFAALLGGALTCGVIPCVLIARDELSRIAITSPSLHSLVTGYGYDFLPVLIVSASIAAVFGIIILGFQIKDLIFKR